MARTESAAVPEVGGPAPEFNLPSAQGGQFRLGLRTVRGPVVVAFYRGAWSEEDVAYFKSLAGKEDEINLSLGSIVAVGACEPDAARRFLRETGLKSYVLYDYTKSTTREWGLLDSDTEHGDFARPATFLVNTERNVTRAWTEERPPAEELLRLVSEITGLPKEPEEEDPETEKPQTEKPKRAGKGRAKDAEPGEAPAKRPEERRAGRKAAREAPSGESGAEGSGAERSAAREPAPESAGEEKARDEKGD